MEASTEWKISAPHPPTPNFRVFVWDREGAQKCFIRRDQTTGDLKSHHLQAWATLTALSVLPRPPFFQQSCYVGNPLSYKYALPYIYSQYHIMREKCYFFLGHSQPLRGGGGGTCPPGPPLSPALRLQGESIAGKWADRRTLLTYIPHH